MRCAQLKHGDHGQQCRLPAGHASPLHVYVPLLRRRGLRLIGAKAKREKAALDRCRDAIVERSGGLCEVGSLLRWAWCGIEDAHSGELLHHRAPSDRDRGVHDPKRCLWICHAAHTAIHGSPALAYDAGLLERDGVPVG